ncbi:MAG: carbamoylphosphate synthase large subunit, partial [Ardenticatenales bacterium]|nr:carbamoylphosphate synthase large subunit [Ardenticatenales bacterium]
MVAVKCVLLTGGRAPATLELARLFHRAGHRVVMAESVRYHLSRPSRAIARNYRVPPPAQATAAYLYALREIVEREKIDLLVPTCEEIFYVAQGHALLSPHCRVFAEPIERLRPLHNKWLFAQRAAEYGLLVPPTTLLTSQAALRHCLDEGQEIVFKPVYSRFAAKTMLCPRPADALTLRPTPQQPWITQHFVAGRQICTYSIAHQGRIVAHAAYPTEFSAGQGATIRFRAIDHPASAAWVEAFVAQEGFTGQIAFDFIETPQGALYALECNPRLTSGIHLLAEHPDLPLAFLGEITERITPLGAAPSMLALAMLLYA